MIAEGCGWTWNLLSTPPAADFGPGPEAAAEGGAARRGVCFARLPPPTSGQAWRWRRRGTQLDGEFAFYASRRRFRARPGGGGGGRRSWTGYLLCTPLAADFGPGPAAAAEGGAAGLGVALYASRPFDFGAGPVAAAEGRAAGRGVCFLRLSPLTLGLARRRRGGRRDGPARRKRHRRSTYCCCGSPPLPDYRSTVGHAFVWFCICIPLVSECAPTRRLPPTSPSQAG